MKGEYMDLKDFLRKMLKDNREWNLKNNNIFFKEIILKLTISCEKVYPTFVNVILPIMKIYIKEYSNKERKIKWVQQEAVDCIRDSLYFSLFDKMPDKDSIEEETEVLCEKIEEIVKKIPDNCKEIEMLYEKYLEIRKSVEYGIEDSVFKEFAEDYMRRIIFRNGKFIEIRGEKQAKELYVDDELISDKVCYCFPNENNYWIELYGKKGGLQYFCMDFNSFEISETTSEMFLNTRTRINRRQNAWKKLISSMVRGNFGSYKSTLASNKSEYECFYNMGFFSDFKYVKLNNLLSDKLSLETFEKQFKEFFDGDNFVFGSPIDRGRYVIIRDYLSLFCNNSDTKNIDLTEKVEFLLELRDKLMLDDVGIGIDIAVNLIVNKMGFEAKDLGDSKAFEISEYTEAINTFSEIRNGALKMYLKRAGKIPDSQ